jgi:flagellar protein FlgJ
MDTLLQDLLRQQQVQEAQRKREQQLTQQQQMDQFVSSLPEAEQARFRAFPTQAAEAMFREAKPAPGVVGEYNAAVQSGLITPDTTLEQYVAMKKPPAAVATAISGGRPDTFQEEVKKGLAKEFGEIRKSGIAAQRSAQDVNRLETLLSKVDTGGAAAFKQAAGNFGIKTEGLDDIQAAQAIINKLVPAQRPAGSGPMSDADLELFKQSMPRIINQPGGNKLIIDGMKRINQYLIEEGKIAAEVTAGRITPDEGTRKMFALGNPVQDLFDRTQGGAGLSAGQPMPQGDLELINRYLGR